VNELSIFDGTLSNIENGLSYASLKQKTIAQNIANVDTPNYKAKDVSFHQMLEDAKNSSIQANKTDSKHFDFQSTNQTPGVVNNRQLSYRNNGNSVDMDKEQASLAENSIFYNTLIERENGKLNSLLTVIKGGN